MNMLFTLLISSLLSGRIPFLIILFIESVKKFRPFLNAKCLVNMISVHGYIVYTDLSEDITSIKMDIYGALEFVKYAHNIFEYSKAKVFN